MAYMKQGCWLPDEDKEGLTYVDTFDDFGEPEPGRYHLYISLACPFAHRPNLVRSLMGLEDALSVSSVSPKRYECGWAFDEDYVDPLFNLSHLQHLYTKTKADYSGRVTVPVLWDKKRQKIASNDSLSIAQWLAREWQPLAKRPVDLLPVLRQTEIMASCEWLNEQVNLGVYKAGFANDQHSYETSARQFFESLDSLEQCLTKQRYLHGSMLTLSDVLLVPTLLRFDTVYYTHFKLNHKRLQGYPVLWAYLLELMQMTAVRETVDMAHIKLHYFYTHDFINPHRLVPIGPAIDWNQAHGRDHL